MILVSQFKFIFLLLGFFLSSLVKSSYVRNVALNKETSQSSTLANADSSRAVDGSYVTFAQTDEHFSSYGDFLYWKLSLGGSYLIERIVIFHILTNNCDSCCSGFTPCRQMLSGYSVEIEDENENKLWEWSHDDTTVEEIDILKVDPPLLGVKVIVKVPLFGQGSKALVLSEVEVYGMPVYNAAFGMKATQKSTYGVSGNDDDVNNYASQAVNGAVDEFISHTKNNGPQWWKVELGKPLKIYFIKIFNRIDHWQSRLRGFKLTVTNNGFIVYTYVHNGIEDPPLASTLTLPLGTLGDEVMVELLTSEYLHMAEVQVFTTEKNTFLLENVNPTNTGKVLRTVSCANGSNLEVADKDENDNLQKFYRTSDGMIGSYHCDSQEYGIRMSVTYDKPGTIMNYREQKFFTADCSSSSIVPADEILTSPENLKQQWIFNRATAKIESVGCPGYYVKINSGCIKSEEILLGVDSSPLTENMLYEPITGTYGYITSASCLEKNLTIRLKNTFDKIIIQKTNYRVRNWWKFTPVTSSPTPVVMSAVSCGAVGVKLEDEAASSLQEWQLNITAENSQGLTEGLVRFIENDGSCSTSYLAMIGNGVEVSDATNGSQNKHWKVIQSGAISPTEEPSQIPSTMPSDYPSSTPSDHPSSMPSISKEPSISSSPSKQPSISSSPSEYPSNLPSNYPSKSTSPSYNPSYLPSTSPSNHPSRSPSDHPSDLPSNEPSHQPSGSPSQQPSDLPSKYPSKIPSDQPTGEPSRQPSKSPSKYPSDLPSDHPSKVPSNQPSGEPSNRPSGSPSDQPSISPSGHPSTLPTGYPSYQPSRSLSPSENPSVLPSGLPSRLPSNHPSKNPSNLPSEKPSIFPSQMLSMRPSDLPSSKPSTMPSDKPSDRPLWSPSRQPSSAPSEQPSAHPSGSPSIVPSIQPSVPLIPPSYMPSQYPSINPSNSPTNTPSVLPSGKPSAHPSNSPSRFPSSTPSSFPSDQPSSKPSQNPSHTPSNYPSSQPSVLPSIEPSSSPSLIPSTMPSAQPTSLPSSQPSDIPSDQPSQRPSRNPSVSPSEKPSISPSQIPSDEPSVSPTAIPSTFPTEFPSFSPSQQPTLKPSQQPSISPSDAPSGMPSLSPSLSPSGMPSLEPSSIPSNSIAPSRSPSSQPSDDPSRLPSSLPSLFPSTEPSLSILPSTSPSVSSHPTTTFQPSSLPTTSPSMNPSSSNKPSQAPSAQPSQVPSSAPSFFRAFFDGESCRFEIECIVGTCLNNRCKSGTLSIKSLIDGQTIDLDLIGFQKFGNPDKRGGLLIDPDNTVQLFGNVHHSFALSRSIAADKFSRMTFSLTESTSAHGTGFCFFQDFGKFSLGSKTYCIVLRGGSVSWLPSDVVINHEFVEVHGDAINLALRRPTTQSSVTGQLAIEAPGDSGLAVDGNTFQVFNNEAWQLNTVSRTQSEIRPWWEVDLEKSMPIREVVIYKRVDPYDDDLKNFTIQVWDSNGISVKELTHDGLVPSKSAFEFDHVVGNRIRIILNGNYNRTLCLAEVLVHGADFSFDIPIGKIFSWPQMSFNRFAFIQDDEISASEKQTSFERQPSMITNLSMFESSQESIGIEWIHTSEESVLSNIQGSAENVVSNNGRYEIVKTGSAECQLLIDGKLTDMLINTEWSILQSTAISDNGLIAMSFGTYDKGILRIFNGDLTTEVFDEPWVHGFGAGLSITPDGSRIAIGSPGEKQVYIYDLKKQKDGSLRRTKRKIILQENTEGFGSKVGLSDLGRTIAVASPFGQKQSVDIGAVNIYVLVEDEWEAVDRILYGTESILEIGSGGVSVDDARGMVYVQDISMIKKNAFKFDVRCSAEHAHAVSEEGNAFRPLCRCDSGFKSSNRGDNKLLIDDVDVCIPCSDAYACGKSPTGFPTDLPSMSMMPSIKPTASNEPSLNPTLSDQPSARPSTKMPTINPTASNRPSDDPSSMPSHLRSISDGKSCRYDNECRSAVCENLLCSSKELRLTILDETTMQSTSATANLVTSWSPTVGEVNVMIGVNIDDTEIKLYGPAQEVFELTEVIQADKYTRLQYSTPTIPMGVQNVAICFHQDLPNLSGIDRQQCHRIPDARPNVDISISDLINSKQSDLKFISFLQDAPLFDESSEIIDLIIVKGKNLDIYDENGCKDPNADTFGSGESTECVCKDGFVASNGGKRQEKLDDCVRCITSTFCGFDSENCTNDDECITSTCEDSKCKARSLSVTTLEASGSASSMAAKLFSETGMYTGGSHILFNHTLQIFGDVRMIYKIDYPISVHKFTRLTFSLYTIQKPENLFICLYENADEVDEEDFVGAEYRCVDIDITNLDNIGESVGVLFDYRMTEINFIGVHQVNKENERFGEIMLSNFTIEHGHKESVVNSDGICKDPHAFNPGKNEEGALENMRCACSDRYVASNGGKILGEYDSCVPCLACALDGDSCNLDRDCMMGTCTNERCVPNEFQILNIEKHGSSDSTEVINAFLQDSERDTTCSVHNTSGISVLMDGRIRLYGDMERFYQLDRNVTVTKFKRISFAFAKINPAVDTSESVICMHENSRHKPICFTVEDGSNSIGLGQLFNDRITSFGSISFQHDAGISEFKDFVISSDEEVDLIDASDACTDPNARRVGKLGPTGCLCMDGYSSSNGGKLQGKYDTCLSCLCSTSIDSFTHSHNHRCVIDFQEDPDFIEGDSCAMPINVDFDIGEFTSTNMTLVDAHNKGRKVGKGGIHARFQKGVTMYQNVWHTYQLQFPFILDDFSRLQFNLQMTMEVDFIGICLSKELHGYTAAGTQHLCIHLFGDDATWGDSDFPIIPFNIALGKPTKQNFPMMPYKSSNAVDGNLESIIYSDHIMNPYWEVNLEGDYMIGSMILHKNTDEDYMSMDDLSNMHVIAYNENNVKVYQSELFTTSENVTTTLVFPFNTLASRLVVSLIDDEKRILSLKEIEIFFHKNTLMGSELQLDIPIGSLFSGEVNYLTLVQCSKNAQLVSRLSDFKFRFGSISN